MKLNVRFSETKQDFRLSIKESISVSDGGYDKGYAEGLKHGYSDGYNAGSSEGYAKGYTDGKTEGYTTGRADGFAEGEVTGHAKGYNEGYAAGYEKGYQVGYEEGYSAGKAEGYTEGHQVGYAEGYEDGVANCDINLQEKTVTENGEVVADEGFDGLSKVTVNVESADAALVDSIINRTVTEIESNVTQVEDHTFYTCRKLARAIFPNATYIGDNGLRDCNSLVEVQIPKATVLQGGSIRGCSKLKKIDLPLVTMMYASVFQGCDALVTVILRASSVCSMSNVNVFTSTPIASGTGFVYVPKSLVESYCSATNWTTYANQIRAIEDYPEITGE